MATTASSSNGKGAASAAPSVQVYVDLERVIVGADEPGIRARWEFGRQLLQERVNGFLPRGRIVEVCAATGRGRTEILFRVKFAERYAEHELSNAIGQFRSWYGICKDGLYQKREQSQPAKPKQRKGSEGGKANHRLKTKRRSTGRSTDELYYMRERVNRAASELEWYDIEGFDWSEWTQELVDDAYDDLIRLQKWVDHALNVTVAHMGDLSRQHKLKLLRARSEDPSSTEHERRTAALAAEKLTGRMSLR